jgi:hypothetical protein
MCETRAVLGYYAEYSGISYRCFGTTYLSHIQRSRNPRPVKMGLTGCPEIFQKSADLIYFAAVVKITLQNLCFCHSGQVIRVQQSPSVPTISR